MKKREIEVYMDAYMEGFWQCYDMMMDMMDDDEEPQAEPVQTDMTVQELFQKVADADSARRKKVQAETNPVPPQISEKPPVVPKPSKPKDEPKQAKNEPKSAKKEPPTHEDYVALFNKGKLPTEVAKELNVSPQTAYNHLYKAKQAGELK